VLIAIGLILFAGGLLLNWAGWAIDRRHERRSEEGGGIFTWFTSVLREFFPLLVGRDTSLGARLAALGAIVCAAGIVVIIVGLLVLLAHEGTG
jgi:hypothetical protein